MAETVQIYPEIYLSFESNTSIVLDCLIIEFNLMNKQNSNST